MVRATALVLLLLTGCNEGPSELSTLRLEVNALKSKSDFESDRTTRLMLEMPGNSTTLRWGFGKGFAMIMTQYGPLSVELKSLEQQGSVTLAGVQIGNPSGASLKGCSAKLQWGKLDKYDMPDFSIAAKPTDFSVDIPAGTWTLGTFTLPKTTSKDVQFVNIDELDCKTMALSGA